MNVLVIGCGRVGAGVARRLALDGHAVTVVDVDPAAFARLGAGFPGRTLVGVGFDRQVLLEAGVERADALAAVTGSDEANAVVARLASRRFGVPRVVARMYDPDEADLYRRLGVQTISPVSWGIERLTSSLLRRGIGDVVSLGGGQVDVVEVEVPPLLDGRPAGELEVPGEIRLIAVERSGRTFVPDAATRLRSADLATLVVAAGSVERLETLVGMR